MIIQLPFLIISSGFLIIYPTNYTANSGYITTGTTLFIINTERFTINFEVFTKHLANITVNFTWVLSVNYEIVINVLSVSG